MPGQLDHVKPHPSEHTHKKTWKVNLNVPASEGFTSEHSFVLELHTEAIPTGGTISVKTSGPVDFDVKPLTIVHPQMHIHTEPKTGLTFPYATTATVEWKEGGEGGQLTDDVHLEVKLIHLTFPDHAEEDSHLTGSSGLLGATRKSAGTRFKLAHTHE